jgi:hypothetical protein
LSAAPGAAPPQPASPKAGKRQTCTATAGAPLKKGKMSSVKAGAGRSGLSKVDATRRAKLPPSPPPPQF